jgi:hypothetical protein
LLPDEPEPPEPVVAGEEPTTVAPVPSEALEAAAAAGEAPENGLGLEEREPAGTRVRGR